MQPVWAAVRQYAREGFGVLGEKKGSLESSAAGSSARPLKRALGAESSGHGPPETPAIPPKPASVETLSMLTGKDYTVLVDATVLVLQTKPTDSQRIESQGKTTRRVEYVVAEMRRKNMAPTNIVFVFKGKASSVADVFKLFEQLQIPTMIFIWFDLPPQYRHYPIDDLFIVGAAQKMTKVGVSNEKLLLPTEPTKVVLVSQDDVLRQGDESTQMNLIESAPELRQVQRTVLQLDLSGGEYVQSLEISGQSTTIMNVFELFRIGLATPYQVRTDSRLVNLSEFSPLRKFPSTRLTS